MREELKQKIKKIIINKEVFSIVFSINDIINRIADLIDREYATNLQPETDVLSLCDEIDNSHEKLDEALKEHFEIIDKITDYLKVK